MADPVQSFTSRFRWWPVQALGYGEASGASLIEQLWHGKWYFCPMYCGAFKDGMHSIWYGVQTSIDGEYVLVMLRAMWPSVQNISQSTGTYCIAQGTDEHLIQPIPYHLLQGLPLATSCVSSCSGLSRFRLSGCPYTRCMLF